jgi:hypothetical protein
MTQSNKQCEANERLNKWKEEIRRKLASHQGIHCQQARLLAEAAAALVQENAADRQKRIKWLLSQARENGFNLKLSVTDDAMAYTWKQRRLRIHVRRANYKVNTQSI